VNIARKIAVLTAAAVGATAILLGTHFFTASRIAAQEHAAELAAIASVLPTDRYDNDPLADRITIVDAAAFGTSAPIPVLRARLHGAPSALVLEAVAPNGYGGPIRLIVGVQTDGTVLGVRVLEHHETAGLGDAIEAAKSDWITRFTGKSLGHPTAERWAVKKDGGDFDQLSGATVTPRALIAALKNVLSYVQANRETLFAKQTLP
jgi:electron transport complex protein RnfG